MVRFHHNLPLSPVLTILLMDYYPLNLTNLAARQAVVIGGGNVAARKVHGLLQAGANITVISPKVTPQLQQLQAEGQIRWLKRSYQPGDLTGAFLAIAATNNAGVNQQVLTEAQQRGCLINVVDNPGGSNFIDPATVRRGPITLTVSTGGASPALARWLREQLENFIGPEYGELAALLAELRPELRQHYPDSAARAQAVFRLLASGLPQLVKTEGFDTAKYKARQLLELDKG